MPKHAFNFWTANLDRLPVKTRLVSWGLDISISCLLCSVHDENRDHLFFKCHYSSQVWRLVLSRFGNSISIFQTWNNVIDWMLNRSSNGQSKILKKIACQATVYHIWKERNSRLHTDSSISPITLFNQIDRVIRDTLLARRFRKGCTSLLSDWFTFS